MTDPCRVFIFGDQTGSFATGLQQLLLNKSNPYLVSFIERTHLTLREEISRLPATESHFLTPVASIHDLLTRFQKGNSNAAIESVLTCLYQLCCFINTYGNERQIYPPATDNYVVGLCVGSLAAAAISSSQSLSELMVAGIVAIRVALKVGLRVLKTASLVDTTTIQSTKPWSYAIPATVLPADSAEEILERFRNQDTPLSCVPYISAISPHSVTVSGAPHVIDRFLQTCLPPQVKSSPVSIYAPYHAPHIFRPNDIQRILLDVGPIPDLQPRIPVISGSSGAIIEAHNFSELLREAIGDMLLRRLDVTQVARQIASIFHSSNRTACVVTPISTSVAKSLIATVHPSQVKNCTVDNSIMESVFNAALQSNSSSGRPQDSKIAIVGMSGRFPDAANLDSFWDLLYRGADVHRNVPRDRFDAQLYYDATGHRKNTSKVMNGCWIQEPGLFDPKFFNISPKEAEQSDPGQRLALQTAYEALEMAGIVPDRTSSTQRDRVGVFYGMTSDDWREVNSGQNVDTYFIPGGNRAFTPGRLNYYFKFSGPSVSVDTACSSSLAAIHMACSSLWRNDCDTAIAGGTNILTNPDNFAGLDRGHFLSRTGNCNTFDDAADGYCRADGVGTVILKRLEDALADKDPILAVIIGAYTNHSAESVSITRPHAGAQEYIFSKLLNEGGVHPYDVSYIEMHGTGTQAGDATEMSSVLSTFAPGKGRLPHQSLYLGSAKSNIGHAESASGIISLIKVLLMMEKDTIPPHCGIKGRINHRFPTDLHERNVFIASQPTAWNRPNSGSGKRQVFVNNFSAAGGNSALLLEDAPCKEDTRNEDPRSTHIVVVSAKSTTALRNNLKNLNKYVQENGQSPGFLPKLSYTTSARRIHYPFRVAIAAENPEQLFQGLESALQMEDARRMRAVNPGVAFAFSGQGAQYSGMGQHLLEHSSVFRSEILAYDQICISQGFPSIIDLFAGQAKAEDLDPLVVQLGTTCLQMALATFWKSVGVEPDFVVGHSLGHYAALKVAGVLSASDTIYLTGIRARLLQEKCEVSSHAMLAVRASLLQVNQFLDSEVHEVACVNSPQEVVISGKVTDIEKLARQLAEGNIKVTKINVPFAFHSAQVDPVLKGLVAAASGITFNPPKIPVISALLAKVIRPGDDGSFGPDYLRRHCRETVNFADALQAGKEEKLIKNNTIWIEIGPHTVSSAFLKSNLGPPTVTVPSLRRNENDWKILANSLVTLYQYGLPINWDEYHRDFEACQEVLRLPTYSWDNKTYWIQYVHDWTLTKGDPPTHANQTESLESPQSFSTAAVQQIIRETANGSVVTLVAQSDFASPQLSEVANGHKVNGARLCTSSLYAEIGLTLGKRLLEKERPDLQGYAVEVYDMAIDKPLILKDRAETLFRAEVIYDKASLEASMSIYSVDSQGNKTVDHARCGLRFGDPQAWLQEWDRTHYLIERSIDWLENRVDQGFDSLLSNGMIYKVFSSLVDYSDAFKGLQEVILSSIDLEATGKVKFQTEQGNFLHNPMWIDSCGQTTGFLMNGHESTPKDQVFINHGWKSLRWAKDFRKDAVYRTYIRMKPVEGTKYAGDLYVLEDGVTVAVYSGMTFQGVSRRILDMMLPPGIPGRNAALAIQPAPVSSATSIRAREVQKSTSNHLMGPTSMELPLSADPSEMGLVRPVLRILSEEIGLPLVSLTDDLVFADYGVDSLLSLAITGRMREDLGMEVDSSIFITHATLGQLKAFLGAGHDSNNETSSSSSTNGQSSPSSLTSLGGYGTPNGSRYKGGVETGKILNKVCAVLVNEIGVSAEDLARSDNFEELGMDSLLSLTVLGRLREEHQLDLAADFFSVYPSFSSIKQVFQRADSSPDTSAEINDRMMSQYHATSTLLQGNPKTARHILFLFPDGSGSATSYAALNRVSSDVCVYGLNCPWLKSAEKLVEYGLVGLAMLYVAEIRRRRPRGPYSLGGWSAGGICAYEAAIQFTIAGEVVENLVLLDSPGPIGLEKLPPRLFHFLNERGTFGDKGQRAPEWLLSHFLAFIDALDMYKPIPWGTAIGSKAAGTPAPKTHMLWAEDGVCKHPSDPRPEYREDDPREMRWLLENRTNFGANGWDVLLGRENISIERIRDANHFTMLQRGKNAEMVARFLQGVFV